MTCILYQVPVLPERKDQVQIFVTPWITAHEASLSITNSWSLLKFIFIKSVMPSNHLILCRPLRLLPSILPSIRVLSNESVLCIRWSKYWIFSFSVSPSNEYSRLISFRTDPLDLLAVQGTLKSQKIVLSTTVQKHRTSVLSFLYSSTLTTIHDHWKKLYFWPDGSLSAK